MIEPKSADYELGVFINCPFDPDYRPVFEAIVFAAFECGPTPRCALEAADGSDVRIDKIVRIIAGCRWAIHDISRTELNTAGLPRFNMPFELGLFIGARRFGNRAQRQKNCLILDHTPHRYQAFLSDIAGQDIDAHGGAPAEAIKAVRRWLATARAQSPSLPGAELINTRYRSFKAALPDICAGVHMTPNDMTFVDLALAMREWLSANVR